VVEYFDLKEMDSILGMFYDSNIEAFYVYSKSMIMKIDVSNENKDAWKMYLDNK
jgi:hypothetical protein